MVVTTLEAALAPSGIWRGKTRVFVVSRNRTCCQLLPILCLSLAVREQAGTCRLPFLLVTAPDYKCAERDYSASIPRPRQQSRVSWDEVKENQESEENRGAMRRRGSQVGDRVLRCGEGLCRSKDEGLRRKVLLPGCVSQRCGCVCRGSCGGMCVCTVHVREGFYWCRSGRVCAVGCGARGERKEWGARQDFMECQEHPFHKGKSPAASESNLLYGNGSALHRGFWPQIRPQDVCQMSDPWREEHSFWVFTTPWSMIFPRDWCFCLGIIILLVTEQPFLADSLVNGTVN